MWHYHVVILELTTSTIPLPIQRETDEDRGAKTVTESESSNKNGPWRVLEALGEWKNNRKARRQEREGEEKEILLNNSTKGKEYRRKTKHRM